MSTITKPTTSSENSSRADFSALELRVLAHLDLQRAQGVKPLDVAKLPGSPTGRKVNNSPEIQRLPTPSKEWYRD